MKSLEDRIIDHLRKCPGSTVKLIAHTLVFYKKSEVNSTLYALERQGLVCKGYVAGSAAPVWKLASTMSQKEPVRRVLIVDLDHWNKDSTDGRIRYFDGEVYGFCKQDIGSCAKFPNMKVKVADWNCKEVTDYNMYTFAYELIRVVDRSTPSIHIYVLSRDDSLENIVHAAHHAGQLGTRVKEPEALPEVAVKRQYVTEGDTVLPLAFQFLKPH